MWTEELCDWICALSDALCRSVGNGLGERKTGKHDDQPEISSVRQSISIVLSFDKLLRYLVFLLEESDPIFKITFSGDNQAKLLKAVTTRSSSGEYR